MSAFILFEESGNFRAARILSDNDSSAQVELNSGKRSKIKNNQILITSKEIISDNDLQMAQQQAEAIEVDFLWECAPLGEFSFTTLANEYFGNQATTLQAISVLFALQNAPIYFHRRGRGKFLRAPEDILKAALAGQVKKIQQQQLISTWLNQLIEGKIPDEFLPISDQLLFTPDGNRPEVKAIKQACEQLNTSSAELFYRAGAIASPYRYHLQSFLLKNFPQGVAFNSCPPFADELDLPHNAEIEAFSIDDANTSEIDDAFSLRQDEQGNYLLGIHIAAPACAFALNSELGFIARARLSTVYLPGAKFTMFPKEFISSYTLAEGKVCPCLSLYLTISNDFQVLDQQSKLEKVYIAANLRHHSLNLLFNSDSIASGLSDFPFKNQLLFLWQFANHCESVRGKSAQQGQFDYDFAIAGDLQKPEQCRISITARTRGSPIDKLVAEMMIYANCYWGGLLGKEKIPAIYRAQQNGKVKMTTYPLPHEGLGVAQYAWSTSPLRRYVDLVNQWQLISVINQEKPVFPPRSAELFAIMRDFDLTYRTYSDFQRQMETYWSLRWLEQEGYLNKESAIKTLTATVRRDGKAKIDLLPLVQAISNMPQLPAGQVISVRLLSFDLFRLSCQFEYLESLQFSAEIIEEEENELENELEINEETLSAEEQLNQENVPSIDLSEAVVTDNGANTLNLS